MSWIKNITLVLISLAFSYCILMVGDRYIERNIRANLRAIQAEAQKIENARVTDEDLPQRKVAISEGYRPALYPGLMDEMDIQYPLIAGLPGSKTYYCNEGYGLVKYTSDRFGFRNDDRLWNSNTLDIVIGDSYVHGACVGNTETLPSQIAYLSGIDTLNLGISGNNPSHYLTYSSLFIPKLRPKTVYLVFYPNDFGLSDISAIEEAYIKEGHPLIKKDKLEFIDKELHIETGLNIISALSPGLKLKKPEKEGFLNRTIRSLRKRLFLPTIGGLVRDFLSVDDDEKFSPTRRSIAITNELCREYGCELTVIFIPNSFFYRPDAHADKYADLLKKLSNSLKLRFVDARDVIDRSRASNDYAIKGPHLSADGYKKVAEFVVNKR